MGLGQTNGTRSQADSAVGDSITTAVSLAVDSYFKESESQKLANMVFKHSKARAQTAGEIDKNSRVYRETTDLWSAYNAQLTFRWLCHE